MGTAVPDSTALPCEWAPSLKAFLAPYEYYKLDPYHPTHTVSNRLSLPFPLLLSNGPLLFSALELHFTVLPPSPLSPFPSCPFMKGHDERRGTLKSHL